MEDPVTEGEWELAPWRVVAERDEPGALRAVPPARFLQRPLGDVHPEHPLDPQLLEEEGGRRPGAAAEVQHRGRGWQPRLAKATGEEGHTSAGEVEPAFARDREAAREGLVVLGVEAVELRAGALGAAHRRRRMLSRLTRKLDRATWTPTATRVAPGITRRMVCA